MVQQKSRTGPCPIGIQGLLRELFKFEDQEQLEGTMDWCTEHIWDAETKVVLKCKRPDGTYMECRSFDYKEQRRLQ